MAPPPEAIFLFEESQRTDGSESKWESGERRFERARSPIYMYVSLSLSETNRAVQYNWMFLLFIHTLISIFFFNLFSLVSSSSSFSTFAFFVVISFLSARLILSTGFQSGDDNFSLRGGMRHHHRRVVASPKPRRSFRHFRREREGKKSFIGLFGEHFEFKLPSFLFDLLSLVFFLSYNLSLFFFFR